MKLFYDKLRSWLTPPSFPPDNQRPLNVPWISPETLLPQKEHGELNAVTEGMTTEKWSKIRPQLIDVWNVVLIQKSVNVESLFNVVRGIPPYGGDPFPHIVSIDGALYVEDGHRRVTVWRLLGKRKMPMRVYNDQEDNRPDRRSLSYSNESVRRTGIRREP